MGISFKGRTPDWQYWVFDIDGRDWTAVNQSTQEPLNIQFQGRYQNWPASLPLTKEGGFDILSSTTTGTSDIDEKRGTVEWLWNGTRYKSSWAMFGLEEIIAAYEGAPAVWNYHLKFIGRVPYDGPTGGGVGTGVTSQATIEISNQITPSAQLSTAAPEQQSPMPMTVTSKPVTSGIATPTAIQAAQSEQITPSAQLSTEAATPQSPYPGPSGSNYPGPSGSGYTEPPATKPVTSGIVSKTVIDAQKGGYPGPSGSGYTEPSGTSYPGPSGSNYPGPSGGGGGGGGGGGYTPKKVTVFEPSKPYGGPSGSLPDAAAAAGPDWVKLGLQLGAAYLLLS